MKLGCFAFANQIETVETLGYDCIELDLTEICAMSEGQFDELRRRVEHSKLGFEVFSGLIPLSVRFHAPDFDEAYWLDHVALAAKRSAQLGAVMIPFGAGKCRSIPEDCEDVPAAKEHVRQLVRKMSDILASERITMVVEPLGPANSNYLNTIPETVEFIKAVNRPNCLTMCDMRHMFKLDEPFSDIAACAQYIRHAHIDYPRGAARLFPQEADDYDYRPYIRALREADYDAILTIEATDYADFAKEAGASQIYLRKLLAE